MQERCKSKLIISLLHGCPFRLPSHVFPAPCPALPGDGLPEGSRSQPTPAGSAAASAPGSSRWRREQWLGAPAVLGGGPGRAWGSAGTARTHEVEEVFGRRVAAARPERGKVPNR